MGERRKFLKNAACLLPLAFVKTSKSSAGYGFLTKAAAPLILRDYFKELGIKSFINAAAPYSSLSGAQMWPEVIEAMTYAAKHQARWKQLHDEVGRRIAAMIGSEAAMVSAGAASAITLATAACMTGANEAAIRQLPDPEGLKNEVIIQKAHRYDYEHAVRNCGARFIEVETIGQCERSVNDKTAMMLFNYIKDPEGKIGPAEFVETGKKYKVPTLVDGAVSVPPPENLSKLVDYGFDLAAFSGGKGLRGPYSAGLLLGRRDLVEAARLNSSPNDDTIGRGMKVSKEELLGMMVAVEVSLKHDFQKELKTKRRWLEEIARMVGTIPGLKTEIVVYVLEGNQPHLRLIWDKSLIKITPAEAIQALREGEPSVEACLLGLTGGKFEITAWMMEEDEVEIVARRLREILS